MKDPRAAVARFYDLDREPLNDLPFYVSRIPNANAARLFSNHGFDIVERRGGYAGETYGVGPELVIQARPSPNADRFARSR